MLGMKSVTFVMPKNGLRRIRGPGLVVTAWQVLTKYSAVGSLS
jgi:hypothetical protein